MKQQQLFPDDPLLAAVQKREEIEGTFCNWLQQHFKGHDTEYISMLIDAVDDSVFGSIAEQWATNNYKNKAYY